MAAGVGDRQPVEGMVGDMAHDRIIGAAIGKADDTGGESEQVEQADHRKQRQDAQYIRLRLRPPDGHQANGDGNERNRHQQDQHDAAAAPRRLRHGHRFPGRIVIGCSAHAPEAKPVDLKVWPWMGGSL
jgi:hypothetical protein